MFSNLFSDWLTNPPTDYIMCFFSSSASFAS